jgi:hypothetical protein
MATAYPANLDSFSNPISTTNLAVAGALNHPDQHANANDAIEAIEAKLGIVASTPALYKALFGSAAGSSVWDHATRKNLLYNGAFRICQRLPVSSSIVVSDNAYQAHDRWKTLADASPQWVLYNHTVSPYPSGTGRSVLFSAGNASAPKAGYIQILEYLDTMFLQGLKVSAQARPWADASITDIRMGLLAWSGTANAPTDPISSWNAAGTPPTLATNWTWLGGQNTAINANVSPWSVRELKDITVPSTANNLALMIWCEDTSVTLSQNWGFTEAQLEVGSICTAFERMPYGDELASCMRFARVFGGSVAFEAAGLGFIYTASTGMIHVPFGIPMRATPSLSYSALADWIMQTVGGTTYALNGLTVEANVSSPNGVVLLPTTASTMTTGNGVRLIANNTTNARLTLSSEL